MVTFDLVVVRMDTTVVVWVLEMVVVDAACVVKRVVDTAVVMEEVGEDIVVWLAVTTVVIETELVVVARTSTR